MACPCPSVIERTMLLPAESCECKSQDVLPGSSAGQGEIPALLPHEWEHSSRCQQGKTPATREVGAWSAHFRGKIGRFGWAYLGPLLFPRRRDPVRCRASTRLKFRRQMPIIPFVVQLLALSYRFFTRGAVHFGGVFMAIVELTAPFAGLSGKVGKLGFARTKYGTVMRELPERNDPKTLRAASRALPHHAGFAALPQPDA